MTFSGIRVVRTDLQRPIRGRIRTSLVNSELKVHPPMQIEHLERSHRLGPKVSVQQPRQRPIIARFRRDFAMRFTDPDSI